MKGKVNKSILLKKGKEMFGNSHNFTMWLNTDNNNLGCKPIDIWESKKGLNDIYKELERIEK